jgi:hypothetical protein
MAFPQVAATNSGNSGANATTHTVNLPSGISAGDLLVIFWSNDGTATASITTPASGWTTLVDALDANASTPTTHLYVWYRVADGGEGSTITVTTTAGEGSAYTAYRITGHNVPTDPPEYTGANPASSANPNPPSETASWGSADNLWIVGYGWDANVAHNAYPANYTSNQLTSRWANTGGSGIASATREVATATEDPGTATLASSEQWAAVTVVIRPVVAGNVTVTPTTVALTTATFAPTVTASNHQLVTPTTVALTTTTFAPTVTVAPAGSDQTVTPPTVALTLTTFAPTVTASDHKIATPTTVALTVTTFAPTVTATNHQVVTPTTVALTITTFAPTVTATNHQVVTPTTVALTLTTFAPTVTSASGQTLTPATATLTLATFAPTVTATDHQLVVPSTAELVITLLAPTVIASDHQTVTPSPATLVLTTFAPTASQLTEGEATIVFTEPHTVAVTFLGLHEVSLSFSEPYTVSLSGLATYYDYNDTISSTASFLANGSSTDPSTVTLRVYKPDGTVDTYTYAGGTITRSGTGIYSKSVTADQRGVWLFRYEGTGDCQASVEGTVTVRS